MSETDLPSYDIDHDKYSEHGESAVEIRWPVEIIEVIDHDWDDRYDSDRKKYGDSQKRLSTKGEYCEYNRLGNSLVNLDSYLSPDCHAVVDAPTEWRLDSDGHPTSRYRQSEGYRVAKRLGQPDIRFWLYERELIEAAKQRAGEDCTTHVRVLAEWFNLAAPCDDTMYDEHDITELRNALKIAAQEYPTLDWILDYGGDPEDWRHDYPPIGNIVTDDPTLDWETELRLYQMGGYDLVRDERADRLGGNDA